MTTRGATLAALLATLGRPAWWILALAGFLVRGGIVLFLLAIVSLPSPLALSNILEPLIAPLYLGQTAPATIVLVVAALGLAAAWLVVGSWFAVATEVVLVREALRAAGDEGFSGRLVAPGGRRIVVRATLAHAVALVPAAIVLGFASVQIFDVTYRELVNPTNAGSIALRVIDGAAGPLAAIIVAWVLGEIVGGHAVRRIVLGGESIIGAVLRSAIDLVRRPVGRLLAPLASIAVLAVDVGAVLVVVMLVWTETRARLVQPADSPVLTGVSLATLGAAWCLALLVTGLINAWRSAAMTFEVERAISATADRSSVPRDGWSQSAPPGSGTIGASIGRRPGDWTADDPGGSL